MKQDGNGAVHGTKYEKSAVLRKRNETLHVSLLLQHVYDHNWISSFILINEFVWLHIGIVLIYWQFLYGIIIALFIIDRQITAILHIIDKHIIDSKWLTKHRSVLF